MDQNSGLKAPKKLACLLVKKCGNNGLELGNFKLITLYIKTAAYMTKIGQKLTDDIFCVCVWYTVVVNSSFDFFGEHKKCKSLPRINRSR